MSKRHVICVHGWTMTGRVFDSMLNEVDRRQVTWHAPTLSGKRGTTVGQLADEVLDYAKANGIEEFVVVGHSLGGMVAQYLAATSAKVKGAVLLCPVPLCGIPLEGDGLALFQASASDAEKRGVVYDMACKELTPKGREELLAISSTVASDFMSATLKTWTAPVAGVAASSIRCPVVCVATDDPFITPEFLTREITSQAERASLVRIPGPGHYVQFERPVETAAVVQAFVSGLS